MNSPDGTEMTEFRRNEPRLTVEPGGLSGAEGEVGSDHMALYVRKGGLVEEI